MTSWNLTGAEIESCSDKKVPICRGQYWRKTLLCYRDSIKILRQPVGTECVKMKVQNENMTLLDELYAYCLWYETNHIENDVSYNFSLQRECLYQDIASQQNGRYIDPQTHIWYDMGRIENDASTGKWVWTVRMPVRIPSL
jgi:hypothetical protein